MLKPHTIVTTTKVLFSWPERISILFGWQMNVTTHIHVDRDVNQVRKANRIAFLYDPRKKQNLETAAAKPERKLVIVKSKDDK